MPTEADGDGQGNLFIWHTLQGVMLIPWDAFAKSEFHTHWMVVKDDLSGGWIDARERMPTKEEADAQGCILAMDMHGEMIVTGWHQFRWNGALRCWKRLPGKPEEGM